MDNMSLYLILALAPLVGSLIAGLLGNIIGRKGAHTVTILGVAVSALLSAYVLYGFATGAREVFNENVYTWLTMGGLDFSVGFMVDALTATMLVIVTSVSLMVHIYTIGYMSDDDGYQRFFSYISLFTFSMLMLVMSNNFIQLFFGWEAVGLVSYLLIGFYFKKPTAIFANLKAFLVNRVGDFGFILGIGLILAYFGGSLHYTDVFAHVDSVKNATIELIPGHPWSLMTVTCILLFVGAMGKSAQFPLHVWLPDSMEGPTPISALIHAATMVTAGIFMVSRMSPLYELSDTALTVVMVSGAITALFMGFLGMIQNDIKRVIAYSTLSQLGYMTVALGASVYSIAVFHVMTHAFFKALLFLAAGSVIMGMHHDQDMRHMGGLRKYMPITWITMLIGSLSLIGTPFFSGFYSKDSIIEAVHASNLPASGFAYFALMASVFVTAFYSFRLYFLVFHGKEKWRDAAHDADHNDHAEHHGLGPNDNPHESPLVVTIPLVLLAIPSVLVGMWAMEPMLFGHLYQGAIHVDSAAHPAMSVMHEEFHGTLAMVLHSIQSPVLWLALAGVLVSWFFYMKAPHIPAKLASTFSPIYKLLDNKYYLDTIYYGIFAKGSRALGTFFWKICDIGIIDNCVNGAAKTVGTIASVVRRMQTGFIYTYATAMVVGVLVLVAVWFWPLISG
ncbi:NADH-quinone oxidoreductase subunit L [Snodgrassella sp. CFCC 13594]|uniref:NADH-quinone oxidoreductase subunit L n=1 Tax=Snodgrassella sp. CFCC 13594 TaxID=1775559 RepID=UPI00083144C7|nr:NADH-quinone oxidoreductase subunit L [Snodgrassella sp. CFCC 13594]